MKFGSPPRMYALVTAACPPLPSASRPGTSRTSSPTLRAWDARVSSAPSTVTDPVAEETGRAVTVAVS